MIDQAYVYMMASSFRKLYIGMTTDLQLRVSQHKRKTNPGCHTAKYTIDKLVYYKKYALVVEAIRREKVLKGWLRARKLELIITTNPLWNDLSEDWEKQAEPFDFLREAELLRKPTTFTSS